MRVCSSERLTTLLICCLPCLTTTNWEQYALVAPWAVRSTYKFVTSGSGERDLLAFAVLPVLLLRLLYSQLWITVSRHQTARSRHRIVDKSLDFDQVDRERNWYVLGSEAAVLLSDACVYDEIQQKSARPALINFMCQIN